MTCTFRSVYIYLKSLITLNNESSALIFINSISHLQIKYLAKIMSRWFKKIEFYQILPCHLWLAITLGRISLWPCKWEKGHDFTITQYRLHRLHCEQNIKYWWNKILDSWIYYCKISHSEVERSYSSDAEPYQLADALLNSHVLCNNDNCNRTTTL